MSWIFGYFGSLNEQKKLSLSSIYPAPAIKIDQPRIFIAAGGNEFTCRYSAENQWIVLGVGLETLNEGTLFLQKEHWDSKITGNSFADLHGHYLLVRWGKDHINFLNDHIGLRTVYFFKDKAAVYFSSNLEWLTSIMNKVEIDYMEFGSRWLTFNQLSNRSFICNVEKLPPASRGEIKSGIISIETENWLPEINVSEPDYLFGVIKKYLAIELPEKLKMSFGLSGGLDSRFLLSFLLRNRNQKYNIHSFGYNDDPDLQVAKKISDKLALKCFFLQPPGIGSGQFLNKAGEYVAATQLVEPVSSYMKLSVLNNKYFIDKFLIDGALAEFARRQFLNRLLIKGKNSLLKKHFSEIIKQLMVPRPKIFKEEYEEMMVENVIEQLRQIYDSFPDPNEIGPENFADLLIVKYRIPNYFGPEQSRIDTIMPGFMLFAQRNIISASLGIPVKQRKNSQLFYNAIKENYPELEDFPLVKNSTIYPYGLSSLTSHAYTRLKKTIGGKKTGETLLNFLKIHEKQIREIITRDEIREYKPYDEDSVIRIVNDFYSGKSENSNDFNWLLTFEMFRKKLNITEF